MNKSCFVDTSFFKAFIDERDEFHGHSLKIFQKLKQLNIQLITSNYILDETFTVVRSKCGLEKVKQFKSVLEQFEEDFRIIRVLAADETDAWNFFLNDWSKLSFTDCVSFAMMKRLKLTKVVAFDNHFQKAGFQAVLLL